MLKKMVVFFLSLCVFVDAGIENLLSNEKFNSYIDKTTFRYQIAATLIFRNEAPYLKEWIEYYRLLGVERFYMYNNLSTDNYKEVLSPYIKKKIVELIEWSDESCDIPSWNAVQCLAYREAINKAKADRVKWLAILDSDEFLVPRHVDSLTEFLSQYDNDEIGGIRVLWVMFGTSYVDKIPKNQTMIETLLLNGGYTQGMWKSVVRPHRVDPYILGGPHHQEYIEGFIHPVMPLEDIQCNHYWSRDEYYLKNFKIPRRISWGTPPEVCEQWKEDFNQTTPASEPILRFVPKLRKRLGLK
jgi:hypothetical protein